MSMNSGIRHSHFIHPAACLLAAGCCLLAGCGKVTQSVGKAGQGSARPGGGQTSAGAIADVLDADFDATVLKSDKPVLVDFWAPWCGPCRSQSPIVEKVGASYADRLKTVKVNVDDAQQTAKQYQITAIPTLMVFKAGKVVFSRTGLIDEAALSAELQKLL